MEDGKDRAPEKGLGHGSDHGPDNRQAKGPINEAAKGTANGPVLGDKGAGKSGYEKIYDWVAESLVGFDLEANAEPLGLAPHPDGGVVVRFFERDYLVENGGAKVLDGKPTSFNHLSLVAHYAMSKGRSAASGDFVKLSVLSGVPAGTGQGAFDRDAISKPLARKYGRDPEALERAVLRIGGRVVPGARSQTREYVFDAFPRIPLKLVFEEPDEEFGPEFRIMYDSRSGDYMEFEALAFLGGILMKELVGWDNPD
ncbi:MAG: DUF3786 domain-containing protein [Deltaproteobacteria bacterium]|jgi:hypothetical protein|nr:DUF3786 domain-containing protein [Deltaproteobacteria bacterium]